MTAETKICQNCKKEFRIKPEDFLFYEKIKVPPPTWCPECRMIRRMMWRNEHILYKRKSDLSGKNIISQYPETVPFPVYSVKEFYSREWDPPSLEYDPDKSFFAQFGYLQLKTPRSALLTDVRSMETGSVYQNAASRNKNCYMVSAAGDNEECLYSNNLDYSKNSVDCLWSRRVRYSYECVDTLDSNRLFFSQNCRQCTDSWFLYDCVNCISCFGCVGLRNKSYCFWNEQLSKSEYKRKFQEYVEQLTYITLAELKSRLEQLKLAHPRKHAHIDPVSSPTSSGDFIVNSQNVVQGFCIHECQNVRYCSKFIQGRECWDVNDWGDPGELCYESVTVGKGAYSVFFSSNCWPECRELQYCDSCSNSHHLFGCAGLRNASYCILNKQYSKGDYENFVSRIIAGMKKRGEYGEFFPSELSPFAYNETIAQEYFPLTKEQAFERGYSWRDPEPRAYDITVKAENLPDHIKDSENSVLKEVIGCVHGGACIHQCTTAFKIIPQELEFYRTMNLPLPRLCPNCRHYERLAKRNPLKLWHRKCHCAGVKSDNGVYQNQSSHFHGNIPCPNEFETSYAPERPEIVYCEQCYQQEVV